MKFTKQSFAEELEAGMAHFESTPVILEENKQDSLVNALQELNAAAVAYEEAGLVSQASAVTHLMMVLAKTDKKESKKPAKTNDKNNLTKDEKRVFEMFGFGKGKGKKKKPSKYGK